MPDRYYIDDKDRELYKKMEKEGIFSGRNNKEQFMFTLALGFKNKLKLKISTRFGFFYPKDLKPEDEALINAVVLMEKSVDALSDDKVKFQIAEEYARGGLKILVDKIASQEFGSFWKHYELELNEALSEIKVE